jgi:hypothetical protein
MLPPSSFIADMADRSITTRPYEGSLQNTVEDRERARELYKYFRPPVAAEPIDTVLTAHAQLTAWRLNAERSMISLIDEETQYFIAESTKTVHLDDAERYDNPEDAIWAGVSALAPVLIAELCRTSWLILYVVCQGAQSWKIV